MPHHLQDFLRLTSLLAILAGSAVVGSLHAADDAVNESQVQAAAKAKVANAASAVAVQTAKRDARLEAAAEKLVAMELQLAEMSKQLGKNHPKIKQIEVQIDTLQNNTRNKESLDRAQQKLALTAVAAGS